MREGSQALVPFGLSAGIAIEGISRLRGLTPSFTCWLLWRNNQIFLISIHCQSYQFDHTHIGGYGSS